jgi:hypothetical protein
MLSVPPRSVAGEFIGRDSSAVSSAVSTSARHVVSAHDGGNDQIYSVGSAGARWLTTRWVPGGRRDTRYRQWRGRVLRPTGSQTVRASATHRLG